MSTPEIEIKVPRPGESITEVMIGEWYVREGQYVPADKNLVALESDKATFDVPAPRGGIVTRILKKAGELAQVEEVIGFLQPAEAPAAAPPATPAPAAWLMVDPPRARRPSRRSISRLLAIWPTSKPR